MNIQAAVIAAAVSLSIANPSDISAQTPDRNTTSSSHERWALLVPSGTLVPTGAQRGAIKRGGLTAVQLTYVAQPFLAFTSTLGWARSRDVATDGSPKLDVFNYDLGAEVRAPQWANESLSFSSFAGMGAGGRSYNYRKLDVDATHNLAFYASAGGEVGVRRVHVRLEMRDYVTGFKPLMGAGASRTGNDVVAMVGLRLVSR